MNIEIDGTVEDFGNSVSLMGKYGTGEMLDHNGQVMQDTNAFGAE